jgi:SAM-dependent methyltransferase
MAVQLEKIIPWGRTGHEYELMFNLGPTGPDLRILDCGGGPASFTAELTNRGQDVVSVDPLYALSGTEIQNQFDSVAASMIAQVQATRQKWNWSFHGTPDGLLACRRLALSRFLADYDAGREAGRYVVGELPNLPFESNSFDLALCSHLLFLYSDILSQSFHLAAIKELCRVAREVRIFPLLTLNQTPSVFLAKTRSEVAENGWRTRIVAVDYELIVGGNQMMQIYRTPP